MVKIPLAISSGKGLSQKSNNSKLLNLMVHMEESGSKQNHIIINTAGTKLIKTFPDKVQGIFEFRGFLYIATEKQLIRTKNGIDEVLGTVDFKEKVTFSTNGVDIVAVGGNGYAYHLEDGIFTSLGDQDGWYYSNSVDYMDGYFIFNRKGTGQFFISKLYSTKINPIDWASAESSPDNTEGARVINRQLWLFGESTSEVWYDSGDADFPFARIGGATSDVGCRSHKTIAKMQNSLILVGDDNRVYATSGYQLMPISTPTIDLKLSKCSRLTAFSYNERGHWFYVLHIDNQTYVYDTTTQQWHERSSNYQRWAIAGATTLLSGKTVGYSDKSIFEVSIDILTENEKPIYREIITLPIQHDVNFLRWHEAQLDIEAGHNKVSNVGIQISKDYGKTWQNTIYTTTGKVGEYTNRARWTRLGCGRDLVAKITISDAIPIRISGFYGRFS